MKKAQTVIIAALSFSLAGINLFAVNGFGYRAEIPGDAPLTVELLLSFLAQLPFGNKLGHDHQLPSHGVDVLYHRRKRAASAVVFRLLELAAFLFAEIQQLLGNIGK